MSIFFSTCSKGNESELQQLSAAGKLRAACACLYRVYKNQGNTRATLTNFEEMAALKDSIKSNEENTILPEETARELKEKGQSESLSGAVSS
ncbi:MAG: hypothetical protein RIC19_06125 [Phaeodactylibacter sp.]|uniref:hypothetical protein n=1 Tax=Phaeodactylibacter sp. TaxID=1940289 RepID=UPI0032EC94E3